MNLEVSDIEGRGSVVSRGFDNRRSISCFEIGSNRIIRYINCRLVIEDVLDGLIDSHSNFYLFTGTAVFDSGACELISNLQSYCLLWLLKKSTIGGRSGCDLEKKFFSSSEFLLISDSECLNFWILTWGLFESVGLVLPLKFSRFGFSDWNSDNNYSYDTW